MALRVKTLSIIIITLGIMCLLLYVALYQIIKGGFSRIEQDIMAGFDLIERENTIRSVKQVVDNIGSRIENLSIKSADWSQWDDTYKFIVNPNEEYKRSNLSISSLSALKINVLLMFNNSGKLVFGIAIDDSSNSEIPLPKTLMDMLSPKSTLLTHDSIESIHSGIVNLEKPLMIVSRPILTSNGEGPIHGTVIFGKYIDNEEFSDIASVTHLSIAHLPYASMASQKDFLMVQCMITPVDPIAVSAFSSDSIAGYTKIMDMDGKPIQLLRVMTPRNINQQGLASMKAIQKRENLILYLAIIFIAVVGIVLTIVMTIGLEISIIRRIRRLSSRAATIGNQQDFTARVDTSGKDEIGALGSTINTMLEALSGSHQAIIRKNAEFKLLMDTVPIGILSVNRNLRINPQYSAITEVILGNTAIAGADLYELLQLGHEKKCIRSELIDYFELFSLDINLPLKDLIDLNPTPEIKYLRDGSEVWLQIQYTPMIRETKSNTDMLVVIKDITQEKKLSAEVVRSWQENIQLKAIAEDPDLFREFLIETGQIVHNCERIINSLTPDSMPDSALTELFRYVHTIKGVAGSFGLTGLCDIVHAFEGFISQIQNTGQKDSSTIPTLMSQFTAMEKSFNEIVQSSSSLITDDSGRDSGSFIKISVERIKKHIAEVQNLEIEATIKNNVIARLKESMIKLLKSFQTITARRGLARSIRTINDLIKRYKYNAKFEFEGDDTLIDYDIVNELNTPLIHLFRNALDHGIEPREKRVAEGKDPLGNVKLSVTCQENKLHIALTDDGSGLCVEKIREKALQKEIITQEESLKFTPEQFYQLIFRPGFSTAEKITPISGRGMGMDIVYNSITEKLHGTLNIESKEGMGTSFIITVPAERML